MVKINNETSEKFPVTCAVPQGSILGPILFLIFYNDFEDSLNFSKSLQFFFKLGFTPCKTEQPLQGMELQEKETQKD